MSDLATLYSGINTAEVYTKGTFLSEGLYALEIQTCISKTLREGGHAFIVEFKVLESNNEKHPVGSKVSWYQGLKEKGTAFAAIKTFMYAVLGLDATRDAEKIKKDVDPKMDRLIVDACEKQALQGEAVRCQVTMTKTKKTQKDFSLHQFSPYETN